MRHIVELAIVVDIFALIFVAFLSIRLRSDKGLIAIFLIGLVAGGLVSVWANAGSGGWGFVLAVLPFILIMQHAIFLRIVRRPVLVPLSDRRKRSSGNDEDSDWWPNVLNSAMQTTARYFGLPSLAIRYGTSALATLFVGLVAFLVLFGDAQIEDASPTIIHAAKLGAAGAYIYVLLYLGQRNLHHDVTSGGAMWCSVTLAVGPVLASALAYFFHIEPIAAGDATSGTAPVSLGADVIFFMAGLSPRYMTSFVENVVKKALGAASSASLAPPRTIQLTQVAGVTPEIAERLEEEGVSDVHSLAMADPLRLIRNTNFDRREILAWIDEAILMTMFPERWQFLEKEGIAGAVDFVSLVYSPPYKEYKVIDEAKAEEDRQQYLMVLCKRLRMSDDVADDVRTLRSIARRLVNDAQLRLIWVLHNHIADEALNKPIVDAPGVQA